MIPDTLTTVVLALAAFRIFRLLALDDFPPAVRFRNWLVGANFGVSRPTIFKHPLLADWLICPWCSGAWYATGMYLWWVLAPTSCLYAAVPLALSALVGIAQTGMAD